MVVSNEVSLFKVFNKYSSVVLYHSFKCDVRSYFTGLFYYQRVIVHACCNSNTCSITSKCKSYQNQTGKSIYPMSMTPSTLFPLQFISPWPLTGVFALPVLTCLINNRSRSNKVWGSAHSLQIFICCCDITWAFHKCHTFRSQKQYKIFLGICFEGKPQLQETILNSKYSSTTFVARNFHDQFLKVFVDFNKLVYDFGSLCMHQCQTADWNRLAYVASQVQDPQRTCVASGPNAIHSIYYRKNIIIIPILLWVTSDILNIPISTSSMSQLLLNFNLDDTISGKVLNLKIFKSSAIYIQSAMPQIIKNLNRLSLLSSE